MFLTAAPGDPRLFVLERAGRVQILTGGVPAAEPFLDIADRVDGAGEGGLLGLAFPAAFAFAADDVFYVSYTADGNPGFALESRVSRFGLDTESPTTRADPASEEILFRLDQPFANHDGGTLAFRQGLLYLGLGDGGGQGDPQDRAQDPTSPFGKLLRFDPDDPAPWTGEVLALGLRNPFRFAFDRATGDLYVGDVGGGQREEIDVVPAGAPDGSNFGWDVIEGSVCLDDPDGADPGEPACDDPDLVPPIHEYPHAPLSCPSGGSGAVTGGAVYRGSAIPEIQGRYFFADYCQDRVFSLRWEPGGLVGPVLDHSEELGVMDDAGAPAQIVAIGEDAAGELYLVDLGVGSGGEIYRLVPEPSPTLLGLAALTTLALRHTHRTRTSP